MKRSDTSHLIDKCSPEEMRALLELASRPAHQPLGPLEPVDDLVELARRLTVLLREVGASGADLLAEVANPKTAVDRLVKLKSLAKSHLARAERADEDWPVRFLYHAAIAAAVAHHGQSISTIPLRSRQELYHALAARLRDHPLAEVFRKAVAGSSPREQNQDG